MEYQFYDDIEELYFPDPEFKYIVRPNIKTKKYIFGPNQNIYYYRIIKREDFLYNLKGNILYLEFNCGGEVEIINTIKGYENLYLKVIIFTSIVVLSIFILIILTEIIYFLIKIMKNSFIYVEVNNQIGIILLKITIIILIIIQIIQILFQIIKFIINTENKF